MKKIIDYDPATGNFKDKNGMHLFSYPAAELEDAPEEMELIHEPNGLSEYALIKLAGLGYTADEILRMNTIIGAKP